MPDRTDREIRDHKAAFWDALHGDEGNGFHRTLVGPSVERLLALTEGESVLDVACGSGVMARRLASLGGRVTGVDFSAELIERARARGQSSGMPIQYGVVDASDEEAIAALGEQMFDAVVCTMALMDMPAVAPFFRAVRRALRKEGRCVVATAHPAFNSNNPIMTAELEDRSGTLVVNHTMKVGSYLSVPPVKAIGARGEPEPHRTYHRPLHELLGEAFAAGLTLDGLEEPAFGRVVGEGARPLAWDSFWQIPPVLTIRLRPRGS